MSTEREIVRRGRKLTHLSKWRAIKHMQQLELSAKSAITTRAIINLESGANYARKATIDKLAAALDLPSDILLQDPDDLSMDDLMRYNPIAYRKFMTRLNQLQQQSVTASHAESDDHSADTSDASLRGVHEKRHTIPAKSHAGKVTPIQQGIRLA